MLLIHSQIFQNSIICIFDSLYLNAQENIFKIEEVGDNTMDLVLFQYLIGICRLIKQIRSDRIEQLQRVLLKKLLVYNKQMLCGPSANSVFVIVGWVHNQSLLLTLSKGVSKFFYILLDPRDINLPYNFVGPSKELCL